MICETYWFFFVCVAKLLTLSNKKQINVQKYSVCVHKIHKTLNNCPKSPLLKDSYLYLKEKKTDYHVTERQAIFFCSGCRNCEARVPTL